MKQIRTFIWILALAGMVLVAIMTFQRYGLDTSRPDQNRSLVGQNGPGGPFTLMVHTGEVLSSHAFNGQYRLIYFGYSYCPDVCPLELQKMTAALHQLEREGLDTSPIQPIFITVDPERDTPAVLADYVSLFHDRLVGFTGTVDEIAVVAKAYRIYFKKRQDDNLADYLMDHSSIIFLQDRHGGYLDIFTADDGPGDIATALRALLDSVGP